MSFSQNSSSEKTIRISFWFVGPVLAAILTYTTRYFINGDALSYIEIGEALRHGNVWGLANLTYSPAYPVLLGAAQLVFNTTPLNELQVLRVMNFVSFLLAMGSCELFMRFLRREAKSLSSQNEVLLPAPIINLLCYSMFLLAALVWVKVRLLNPDMIIVALMLTCASAVLWIRENPLFYRYVALGVCCGVGYLVKSFFFVYSGVFFLLAALCAGSIRKTISHTVLAVLIMLLVGAPLIASLSYKLGRFTTGELGKLAYAVFIAGEGTPVRPRVIDPDTKTILYRHDDMGTRPSGFDICYWAEGRVPRLDLKVHSKIVAENVLDVFRQLPFIFLVIVWYVAQIYCSSYSFRSAHPPSFYLILLFICLSGTGFYCMVHLETRYLAGPLFLGFAALVMSVRCRASSNWKAMVPSIAFLCVLWLHVLHAGFDQTMRSLQSTQQKPSYKEATLELHTVKDYLLAHGLKQGDETAILGGPPVYWARFAGLRITAEIEAPERFFAIGEKERRDLMERLQKEGIRAIVGNDVQLLRLAHEGWRRVDGTRDYYVIFLDRGHRATNEASDRTTDTVVSQVRDSCPHIRIHSTDSLVCPPGGPA